MGKAWGVAIKGSAVASEFHITGMMSSEFFELQFAEKSVKSTKVGRTRQNERLLVSR